MNYVIFALLLGAIFGGLTYFGNKTSDPNVTYKTEPKPKKINNMEKDIEIIRKWVSFFGILTVANIVIAFIYVLSILS